DALATYETNQKTRNGNRNGSGSQSDGENGSKGTVHMARGTVRYDATYEMSWKALMNMMTKVYCPRNEIQKPETELWDMTVKGIDVVGYTQRFQELALLCPRMVPEEEDKV
nr:reverse transcriptase domain-containing protein [Tanacetum cinerariifolium]